MIEFLKEHSYSIYLAVALELIGIHFWTWQWWAIVVPIVILAMWKASD